MQSEGIGPTLGTLVNIVRGNTYKSALLGLPGPVLLGLASIQRDGGFRGDSLKTYGGESASKLLLSPGDLYVSLKDVTQSGDLLGAVARLPKSVPVGRLTQDTVKLVFDTASYPPSLLYWALRAPEYRSYCRERAIGTTNLSLSRDDFLAFQLPAATRPRLNLVELLERIEHRIDLLRQTNATLESIAQALFKSWFIDFDPVRAKAEGREPEGMDAAAAALFPAEFEESALGLTPNGWTVRSLDSFATYLNGLALQKYPAEREDEYLPVIKIAQLRAGHTNGSDRASARLKPEYIVRDGDVLFSWSGSLEVEFWCGGEGALNQHLFKVTSSEVPKWFYYLSTRYFLPGFREIAAHKATTMGHIQRVHLTESRLALPPASVMRALSTVVGPLISGKLRLPEAQEHVQDALA